MNIITKTALANRRQNKSRNILIGVAIVITALLLTIVPTIGIGAVNLQFAAVNKMYPNFHTMYRYVNETQIAQMKQMEEIEAYGVRQDPGRIVSDEYTMMLLYYDETAAALNKLEVAEGVMPKGEDEIVMSEGMLKALGIQAQIGDTISLPYQISTYRGLGLPKEREFRIVGFLEDTEKNEEEKLYSALVSEAFVKAELPEEQRYYRGYAVFSNIPEHATTEDVKDISKEVGRSCKVEETNIVPNGEYLSANYVDIGVYVVILLVMVIAVLAGIMTIYSIYYVSMMNKVQEYGKLKAIGATKRQIRKLVFREGFSVAVIAIPIGVIAGAVFSYGLMRFLYQTEFAMTNPEIYVIKELLKNHEVRIIQPWIIGMAVLVSLVTVYFSLLQPMKTAGKITPIEAIRFHGETKKSQKTRKGYRELNIWKLTVSNLFRNKKRTLITILTLSIISILFMAIATVLNCVDPDIRSRHRVRRDFEVYIESWSSDLAHPERALNQIQKNNPVNEAFIQQVQAIDGVTKVEENWGVDVRLEEAKDLDGSYYETGMGAISDSDLEELKRYVTAGSIDLEKLKEGNDVILVSQALIKYELKEYRPGDKVHLQIMDGDRIIKKEYTIMAIADPFRSLVNETGFVMPQETLQAMLQTSGIMGLDITAEPDKLVAVETALTELVSDEEFLELQSYEEVLQEEKEGMSFIFGGCYLLIAILGVVGILNLINTMINSVYVRRRELGMLQAIGLSGKQTLRMLQLEGLFYTAGTLVIALGLGNLAGYGCFVYAKNTNFYDVNIYQYPTGPTVILVVTVLVVQLLITYLVNADFKKLSLIDRIRSS